MGFLDLFRRKNEDSIQTQDKQSVTVSHAPESMPDELHKEDETRSVAEPEAQMYRRRRVNPMAMECSTASEKEFAAKIQPIAEAKPTVQAKPVEEAKPAVQAKPVTETKPVAEAMPKDKLTAKAYGGSDVRQEIRWPMNGTNAAWMASSRFFVYADSGFLRSRGASAFIEAWRIEKQKRGSRRSVFVPKFELDKLTPEEMQGTEQWRDVCSVRNEQKDYEELFRAVSDKNWNIVFLTMQGEYNNIVVKAAAAVGVSLKLYMVSEDGRIYAILLSQTGAGQRKRLPATPVLMRQETQVDAFGEPMKLAAISRSTPPERIPTSGSVVYDDKGESIYLDKPVFSDSTSITYTTNKSDKYAKIYTEALLKTTLPEQKCQLMLSRRIEVPGVCWPISGLKTQEGQRRFFVGILVPKAEGVQLREALLRQSMVLKCFEGWDRQDMTRLAIIILKMIRELQKWNVSFGRLNLSTILVKDKSTVYFVDMDAWQIEGYPVLFENRLFDPPETQEEETSLRFFNQDEVNYQIAYLMFMLMMPGRMPYVRSGDSTVVESIRNQEFAFGMGQETRNSARNSREAGAGFWRFVWDHISYDLAKAFHHTFARNGEASEKGTRYGIEKWLKDMEAYHRNLDSPFDSESKKLYPITFRRSRDRKFLKCDFCGVEHPSFYFCEHMNVLIRNRRERISLESIIGNRKICRTCYHESAQKHFRNDKRAYFKCWGCGNVIYYTNAAKFMHEYMEDKGLFKPAKWCPNCKETYEMRTCIDCGKAFPVTVGQYKYSLGEPSFKLPKRCHECLKVKKGVWKA